MEWNIRRCKIVGQTLQHQFEVHRAIIIIQMGIRPKNYLLAISLVTFDLRYPKI